ncbi:Cyclin-Dependent Kinase 20 [Manis pentadactyla]|nr:Cyclin-Dependent Kinase 20 [Manis pentadactyla]
MRALASLMSCAGAAGGEAPAAIAAWLLRYRCPGAEPLCRLKRTATQPRRARKAGHGRGGASGGSPPWTSTASWAASDRVSTASSSRDWGDRCPQEGGCAAAGGWHPPNQVLREIKALQEMEDNQYMSWRPQGESELCGHQEITELPDYKIFFKDQVSIPLGEVLPDISPQALDLLGHFLLYPPHQRTAASQAPLAPSLVATIPTLTSARAAWVYARPCSCACPPLGAADSPVPWVSFPQGPPGYPHVCDFHMDQPLEESLLNPEPIRRFIPEGCDAGPAPLASAPWPPGPLVPLSSLMTSHSFPTATVGPYLALLPGG